MLAVEKEAPQDNRMATQMEEEQRGGKLGEHLSCGPSHSQTPSQLWAELTRAGEIEGDQDPGEK